MKTLIVSSLILLSALQGISQTQTLPSTNELKEPVEVVKAFLTAYQQKDHALFSSFLHPDVVWIQPGSNRISGITTSKNDLLLMGKKMWELSAGTIQLVDVKYYSPNGNTVVAILHWKGAQPTGNVLDITNIDIYTVEDGKIIMAKIFSEDIAAEDKFWGRK